MRNSLEMDLTQFSVVRYTPNMRDDWDNFVKCSQGQYFIFQRKFMEYHNDRFIDHSVIIIKSDKIVSIFPAHEVNEEISSHQGLSYGGLLFCDWLFFQDRVKAFFSILKYYKLKCFSKLFYKQSPPFFPFFRFF